MGDDSWKVDTILIILVAVFVVVVLFIAMFMWGGNTEPPPQDMLVFNTGDPEITQVTLDNQSYWYFSYEVTPITGTGSGNVNWDETSVRIKSENGSMMAEDPSLFENNLNDYDGGEDGSVDLQCWYDDVGVQDGRLGEGDLILITGMPSGVEGFLFQMIFRGDYIWAQSVDLTDR